ncbi:hypothetical protein B296_00035731 [Ensete ventricosum]|uniref:CW-type domain-containing protein n=1 Tax=Ensete ventricosum TaxID=4639 RepID=A0A426XU13_ENSVE|nr:hypothetical protein B296_00035731 [Ensete ventricosum]
MNAFHFLIQAYKRVGGQVHNADMGRGVIGVIDVTNLMKKVDERYKPDHDWVQCNKCRKWRILSSDFNCVSLPPEWFVSCSFFTFCIT